MNFWHGKLKLFFLLGFAMAGKTSLVMKKDRSMKSTNLKTKAIAKSVNVSRLNLNLLISRFLLTASILMTLIGISIWRDIIQNSRWTHNSKVMWKGSNYKKLEIKNDIPKWWAKFHQEEMQKVNRNAEKIANLEALNREVMRFMEQNQDPKNPDQWYAKFTQLINKHNIEMNDTTKKFAYKKDAKTN